MRCDLLEKTQILSLCNNAFFATDLSLSNSPEQLLVSENYHAARLGSRRTQIPVIR
jgi:hypothetical protein